MISTPYWHAKELLADQTRDPGAVFRPEAIAEGVNRFLCDPVLMTATRKRAWKLGREMIWPAVAQLHMESFQRARTNLSMPSAKSLCGSNPG